LCCSVGQASVEEIDELNIFHATMLAMKRAVEGLRLKPVKVLVDGNRLPKLDILSEAIVDGDAKVKSISAASIIAKVTRDRMLVELHEAFPQYGFAAHKGYSTPEHLEALRVHGPCVHHRRHFAPVAAQFAAEAGMTIAVQVQ
jgi:ribonuclease HII